MVNFVSAVAYHFCLNLPTAFSQLGNGLIVEPCTYFRFFHLLLAICHVRVRSLTRIWPPCATMEGLGLRHERPPRRKLFTESPSKSQSERALDLLAPPSCSTFPIRFASSLFVFARSPPYFTCTLSPRQNVVLSAKNYWAGRREAKI